MSCMAYCVLIPPCFRPPSSAHALTETSIHEYEGSSERIMDTRSLKLSTAPCAEREQSGTTPAPREGWEATTPHRPDFDAGQFADDA